MNLSDNGANLIAGFEGFRSCPYRDPVGVWTIGFGSTRGVGPGTPCVTRAQALARLKTEVQSTYGAAVNNVGVPLNQNQFDALCSFTYNCGPGAISASSSVGRLLRARNYAGAANALLAWNRAGGRVLPGLTARRNAERTLFLRPAGPAAPAPAPPAPPPEEDLTPDQAKTLADIQTRVINVERRIDVGMPPPGPKASGFGAVGTLDFLLRDIQARLSRLEAKIK